MAKLDMNQATYSNMSSRISDLSPDSLEIDGVQDQEETTYTIDKAQTYWGYFNSVPELKSAVLMKAIWNVGKGYNADNKTMALLDSIIGWGKDTFEDILFNMEVSKLIFGDSFAEIIRNDEGKLINLKPLDPASIRTVVDRKGMIKRYEQINKQKDKEVKKFKPHEILHFSNNRIADQIHGISVIESLEETINAEYESFKDMKKLMHHQVKPFILWKLKTDDPAKISEVIRKIDTARNLGEDMFIPDDDDAIEYEIVTVNIQQAIFSWRVDIRNKFYRALGLPQIVFGSAGSTESGSKIEYLAHEQVFEKDQKYIERQLWAQMAVRIDLIPPVTLLENLQNDQNKDAQQGLEIQPNDVTAGAGR